MVFPKVAMLIYTWSMIISHGRKYIFVHIPKTGGTAMALALEDRAMKDDIMMGDTPKALKRRRRLKDVHAAGRLWKHSTIEDVIGLVSPQEVADYFVFTLVRNPWDRLVSYYHWLREQAFDHRAVELSKALTFKEFVAEDHTYQSFSHAPYSRYMSLNGQDQCACYIRLEHFEEDAKPLFDHLGFELSLPVVNKSERDADFRHYYDDETASIVADMCRDDIARFGYQFHS